MSRPDHPRTCGANAYSAAWLLLISGSSPHMRGKPPHRRRRTPRRRIIPAHAGQTTCATWWAGTASGSSPHMRGKPPRRPHESARGRIIPAHAGQTPPMTRLKSAFTDHPRTCGANAKTRQKTLTCRGSSPHMRGKLEVCSRRVVWRRIIPAHAGQTKITHLSNVFSTDHPRTCGANGTRVAISGQDSGSSPHMRGKQAAGVLEHAALRIIPAHAGQTDRFLVPLGPNTDHPRTCGANCMPCCTSPLAVGSSPHMRGKLRSHIRIVALERIIPAHAGQTRAMRAAAAFTSDHPRTCGAN